ncbi:MAG TPA: M14 family metallopeptidase [Pseudobdellovibrionaceae bacterium]|nr:M14 family metallopeptidase [Pseudobdellovibrionaceae bacterium]
MRKFESILSAMSSPDARTTQTGDLHFPKNPSEARERFRRAAEPTGAKLSTRLLPSDKASTPTEELSIEIAELDPGRERLLVLTSGVHGPETPAGSRIQEEFFLHHARRLHEQGWGILAIHGINAWGFLHGRRNNSRNVNLNRNFSLDPATFQTRNPGYERLRDFLEPTTPLISVEAEALRLASGIAWRLARGEMSRSDLAIAAGMGQYQFPTGLSYGGSGPEPETQIVAEFFQKHLVGERDRVVAIDLHTGLGSRACLHAILSDGPSARGMEPMRRRLASVLKTGEIEITPTDTAGFYKTTGDMNDFAANFCRQAREAICVTAEFGTIGADGLNQFRTLLMFIAENRGHTRGYRRLADAERLKRLNRELFDPQDRLWQDRVLLRGLTLIEKLTDN